MGIRAVTMDMIAEKLGISKRTLYEQFPNKNVLIKACLQLDMNEMKEKGVQKLADSKNTIEKIISLMFFHINTIKQYSPNFLYDLNKYYPELCCQKTADSHSIMTNKIVDLIETSKGEKLFRTNINSEISAKLVLEQLKNLKDESLLPLEKYLHAEVFERIVITFIRGIATLKGYKLIEKYYQKYKNKYKEQKMKKLSKINMLMLLLILGSGNMFSQNDTLILDLKQAQSMALSNNQNVKNAQIDLKIAKNKIWETTASGLPQVSGQISYNDMLDIPTTLIPDFITPAVYGVLLHEGLIPLSHMPTNKPQYFPAKFGTQHNASYKVQASQLIFNGPYIVGLQASKIFYQLSEQSYIKKKQEVVDNVTNSYYLVLVAHESIRILDSSYQTIEKSARELKQIADAGLADETDAEQLKVTAMNIKNTLQRMKRQAEVSERLLKFQIGIDLDKPIKLTDNLDNLLGQINFTSILADTFNLKQNISYKLLETQEKLTKLNFQREKSTFLPSIVGFFSYQESAMRSQFDIFDKNKPWYPATIIGISIDIPIFSSGQRLMKTQEAKLELEKMKNTKQQAAEGLKMEYYNARNAYLNSFESYIQNKESYALATKIYNHWQIKFREGVATSMELTTQQNQYLTAQANYYNSIFELLSAKIKLERMLNQK